MNDFTRRVDLRQVGKRTLDSMIRAGGMDVFGTRQAMLDVLDRILSVSTSHFRAIQSGQMTFFGSIEEEIILPTNNFIDSRQQLEWERELIGLYVSDHPLKPYLGILQKKITHFSAQLAELTNNEKVVVAGMVTRYRNHQTKNGKAMGFVSLDDMKGTIELVMFPKVWDKFSMLIQPDVVLIINGRLDLENSDPKVLVDNVEVVEIGDDFPVEADDSLHGRGMNTTSNEKNKRGQPDASPIFETSKTTSTEPNPHIAEEEPVWIVDDEVSEILDDLVQSPPIFEAAYLLKGEAFISPIVENPESLRIPLISTFPTLDSKSVIHPAEKSPIGVITVPYLLSPSGMTWMGKEKDGMPRMITITMRSIGNKAQDVIRLNRLHGLLQSFPGKDHFAFLFFESGHNYLVEFPNDTTGITSDLIQKIVYLVGEDQIQIHAINIH